MATGYLSGGRQGRPGYVNQAPGTGYGFLARDRTALEVNDRGWNNLPPWGYARNNVGFQRSGISGMGCCAGVTTVSQAATRAANEYAAAIVKALSVAPPVLPDYSRADALLAQVENKNEREAIAGWASGGYTQISNTIQYGEDMAPAWSSMAELMKIAEGAAPTEVAGEAWTGVNPEAAKKDAENIAYLQRFAMSEVGKKVIQTGAFTSGATGINKEAILKEGERSDIDVASLVKKGESFGNWGKLGLAVAAVGAGYVVAKRLGII